MYKRGEKVGTILLFISFQACQAYNGCVNNKVLYLNSMMNHCVQKSILSGDVVLV